MSSRPSRVSVLPSEETADDLFERYEAVAISVARRYSRGRRLDEDLLQVARMGVFMAARRFDPDKGQFAAYATATAAGEVKKHLRSNGWAVRVPRRLQEDVIAVTGATERLISRLGRAPVAHEIAEHTGIPVERVEQAVTASASRFGHALDMAPPTALVRDGDDDTAAALVRVAVAELDESERELLQLRFESDLTQNEIGERIGISQAQVHRRLSSLLAQLELRLEVAA